MCVEGEPPFPHTHSSALVYHLFDPKGEEEKGGSRRLCVYVCTREVIFWIPSGFPTLDWFRFLLTWQSYCLLCSVPTESYLSSCFQLTHLVLPHTLFPRSQECQIHFSATHWASSLKFPELFKSMIFFSRARHII